MDIKVAQLLKQIVKNTNPKPQKTLEWKMTANDKIFFMDQSILLDEGSYELGITEFAVYNSIVNINETNNLLRYSHDEGNSWVDLIIPAGAYEIEQINDEVHRQLEINGHVYDPDLDLGFPIEIEANEATQHSIITLRNSSEAQYYPFTSMFRIDLTSANSLASLLGFTPQILNKEFNTSENKVNIITIDKCHLCCDIIEGSILNGVSSSILFSFNINVGTGYKIVITPLIVLFKEVIIKKIDKVRFYMIDDDGEDLNFRGETITFTTQLRKV